MQKTQLVKYADAQVIKLVDSVDLTPAEDQVLLEVKAAGVNPFDYKLQTGVYQETIPLDLPVTLGGDFAGKVLAVGRTVTDFQPGDEVYGQAGIMNKGSGTFAQQALSTVKSIAIKPSKLSFAEAAALPLPGVSAVQALFEHLELTANQKILIHGGAGGIGTFAIQIAKHIGAYIATTVSANDMEYVKKLGADSVIDYQTEQFENLLSGYDAVFDLVGKGLPDRSLAILKPNGKLVSMVEEANAEKAEEQGIIVSVQSTKVTRKRLDKLTQLVESGVIEVHVEKTFTLAETEAALTYLRKTPPRGKVVIATS